jgi:threonine/homoserine/homoserine lactone efflux protein
MFADPIIQVPELLIRGVIAGLIIAAPVGPVNVICMRRSILNGWRAGVIAGFGSASADVIYGAIAGFSITFIIQFLIKELFWIRAIGGILLMLIGVWFFFRNPGSFQSKEDDTETFHSTFWLTLTNPTTVLSFIAVLAALGMDQQRKWWLTAFMVGGIFLGSMLWWVILASIMSALRDRFNDRGLLWMNRIAGLAIGGFGVASFLLRRASI